MIRRKDNPVSLDDLDPFELEGTPEDIALVERGLAIMARKQTVWASVVEGWKKRAGISPHHQKNEPQGAEGSMMALVNAYRTDPRSPYRRVAYTTRKNYDSFLKSVLEYCGPEKLADMQAKNFQRLFDHWATRGKLTMARSLITMLRMLFGFGATTLESAECARLSSILSHMQFPMARSRSESLTKDQAIAIISKAHELGYHSIALAQAFQFDCMLRQKDTIGGWVPHSEPGVSDVTHENQKWLHGIRWSEIDDNLVLRHAASMDGKMLELMLSEAPLVMDELRRVRERLGQLPASGAIIVSEKTGLPYQNSVFRSTWRAMANAAGIPKNIKNSDSRPRTLKVNQGMVSRETRITGGSHLVATTKR
jgi:hypothetical protein